MFQPLFGLGLILGSLLVLVPKPTTGFTVRLLGNSNAFGEGPVVDPLPIGPDVFPDPNGKSNNRENVPFGEGPVVDPLPIGPDVFPDPNGKSNNREYVPFGEGPVVDPLPIGPDVFPDPNGKSNNRENVPFGEGPVVDPLPIGPDVFPDPNGKSNNREYVPFGEGPVVDPSPIGPDVFPDPNGKSNNRENVPSSDEIYLENLSVAKPMTDDEIDAYLMRFGYLAAPVNGGVSGKDREAAIKEYQGFSRLSQTGVVDPRTRKQMQTARCGLADPVSNNTFANFNANGTNKWPKKDLTYKIARYSKKLSKEIIRESTEKAFQMWSDVSQLTFKEVSENDDADIRLSFTPRIHGDDPFDGPGHVLAHAFYPQTGEVHMDEAENWTIQTRKGINLLQVLVHEIGHALGLGHSGDKNAIMEAKYNGYIPNLKLNVDDIAGIQFLYGKPHTKVPRIFPCPFRFSATMTVEKQTFGFFRRSIYEIFPSGEYNRLSSIGSVFPRGPGLVEAAAHDDITGHTFLFSGIWVWRYTDQRLDRGFPKRINNSIRAAFVVDGLIGFSFTHIHYFDEDTMEDYVDGEVSIADEYPGLPSGIRSALAYTDGSVYVFYTHTIYRVDVYTKEISEERTCTNRGYK